MSKKCFLKHISRVFEDIKACDKSATRRGSKFQEVSRCLPNVSTSPFPFGPDFLHQHRSIYQHSNIITFLPLHPLHKTNLDHLPPTTNTQHPTPPVRVATSLSLKRLQASMPGHRERLPPQNAQFIQAGGPAAFAPGGIVRGGSHRSSPAPPPPSSRSASTGGKGWPRSQPSTENEPEVEKVAIVAEEVGSRRSLAVHPSRLEAVAGVVVAARQPLGPPASPPPILTINGSTTSTTTSTSQSQWEAPPKVSSHTRSASINYSHVASTLKPEKPPSPWNTCLSLSVFFFITSSC